MATLRWAALESCLFFHGKWRALECPAPSAMPEAFAMTPPAERPRVHSFDLFDTLIARRCISPLVVYQLVEQRSGVVGLAQARSEAGHALWSQRVDHTTLDIYRVALQRLQRPELDATRLAAAEYAVELGELVAVRRHLLEVKLGDVVISDMHHPPWVLAQMLERAGRMLVLHQPASLMVTNRGKHDGDLWRALLPKTGPLAHLGDNAHSDVRQAELAGHQPRFTDWAMPSAAEVRLSDLGVHTLARAARVARLQCVGSADDPLAALDEAMASLVFPVLCLGALLLHAAMLQQGSTGVVFCGRDGAVWSRVFTAVYPEVPVHLLASSRAALAASTPGYRDYVLAHSPTDALLVDLCGSGASWHAFWQRWALPPRPQVFLLRYPVAGTGATAALTASLLPFEQVGAAAHSLEALCEGAHPGLRAAQWHSVGGQGGGLAQLHWNDEAALATTSALAERLHPVLDAAVDALRIELARGKDSFAADAAAQLAVRMVQSLGPLTSLIESASGFMHRNKLFGSALAQGKLP